MTTIYAELIADHDKHRTLLDRISRTQGDSEDRRRLWNEFYYDVKSHAAAEEETFYSHLIAEPKGQDHARHSIAEHHELDGIMEELHSMDFSSPGWLTRFKTLKHDYEHHMVEEEGEIFDKGREVFSSDEEKAFAKSFVERKKAEMKLVDSKAEDSLAE